jgi:hypothetical protein
MSKKQNLGQFNTKNEVWLRPHIAEFIENSGCDVVVDPYAGRGDLFHAVGQWFEGKAGYDIDPVICSDMGWTWMDSLDHMPRHDNGMVVTNPPYLAKNSAARNDLESYDYFKQPGNEEFEDLYQIALYKVLEKYEKAVFIIPETYFQAGLFKSFLHSYTVIEENPFTDTDCPVCIACFHKTNDFMSIAENNYDIYKDDDFLFNKNTLEDILWNFNFSSAGPYAWSVPHCDITFNEPNGNLGLRGVDGVLPYDRVHFCQPYDLHYDKDIKESSRSITIIDVAGVEIDSNFLDVANRIQRKLRQDTHDVILSPFKGNNKLGVRRRRLDYKWARKIVEKTIETLDK